MTILPKIIICTLLAIVFSVKTTYAQENVVKIYFFYGDGCSHCAAEERFLSSLETLYKGKIDVQRYEVWRNSSNLKILAKASGSLGKSYTGVPVTIIGKTYISGYLDDQTTGEEIKSAIDVCLSSGGETCADVVVPLLDSPKPTVKLPILGSVNPKTVSLPLVTVIIGVLDGFNPCAMWTLLFLISILLGMKSKKRRWVLGMAFIFASGFVYFLFMAAWLNFFLILGFISWIRILIGLAAIVFGVYHIRKYYKEKVGGCDTAEDEKRQKMFERIKGIVRRERFVLALLGIVLLAAAVNLVELICSAGFPAIYTGILSMNNLPKTVYYMYIALYILFFMLDDIVVFVVAMVTLEAVGIQSKYARISRFVGGLLLALIGILLIFKPNILMLNF